MVPVEPVAGSWIPRPGAGEDSGKTAEEVGLRAKDVWLNSLGGLSRCLLLLGIWSTLPASRVRQVSSGLHTPHIFPTVLQ